MQRKLVIMIAFGLCLRFPGMVWAGGSTWSQGRGGANLQRGGAVQRYWRPAVPVAPDYRGVYHRYYYPYYYGYGVNPRSIIVITPSSYYPYGAPVTILTSEPYYCHMHNVGFVSRVGFLDHIGGTHKIPLETASSISTESNESCIIEGY
jgi:hypothetical protein